MNTLTLFFWKYSTRLGDCETYLRFDFHVDLNENMYDCLKKCMQQIKKNIESMETYVHKIKNYNINENEKNEKNERYSNEYYEYDRELYHHELWKNVLLDFSDLSIWTLTRYQTSSTKFKNYFDLNKSLYENNIEPYDMFHITHILNHKKKNTTMNHKKVYE